MKALLAAAAVGAGLLLALAAPAHPASAHPLGNFSYNQLESLDLYPDRVQVTAAVDIAELPTLQEKSIVDSNHDGTESDAERTAYTSASCTALAAHFTATAGTDRLTWTVTPVGFRYVPGAAGLATSRLECVLRAPAHLDTPTTLNVANQYRSDRVGWRELTATGHGVALVNSPIPVRSVSNGLTAYPKDLLSSPLDVRSAALRLRPGDGTGAGAPVPTVKSGGNVVTRWTAGTENALRNLVGGRHLSPVVGVLAVLLALVLGAAHAALPGHGKTVMAAYLAGRDGRPRDALVVGATVTFTHTGGVLLLGLLLTTTVGVAGETVLGWLGVVSGVLVAIVGLTMLRTARRKRAHTHQHEHGHAHDHDHDHDHKHHKRLATIGMGIAGGLVPSPSALIILLGAIGLGRTAFGILLVLGYGLGMAATLTAAGLALIRLRDRWARRRAGTPPRLTRLAGRLSGLAPLATAGVVLVVGLGLAGRALATIP
jgi:ABC-type nickel/cobalt efflux system permease component RcnA